LNATASLFTANILGTTALSFSENVLFLANSTKSVIAEAQIQVSDLAEAEG